MLNSNQVNSMEQLEELKLQNLFLQVREQRETKLYLKKNPLLEFSYFKDGLVYIKCTCGEKFPLTKKEVENVSLKERCSYCKGQDYKVKKEKFIDEEKKEDLYYTFGKLMVDYS